MGAAAMSSASSFTIESYPSIEEWRDARRRVIGSSDAAAIWGESPFSSPRSVYAAKVEGVEPDIDPEWAEIGHLLEPVIASLYRFRTGEQPIDPGAATIYRSTRWPWMGASLDRILPSGGVLECKSRGAWAAKEWSEAPALDVVLQVQHQLAVTGWRRGVIGVMFGNQPRFIEVERDDELIEMHVEKCHAFWNEHVVAAVPPPVDGHRATSDVLKKYRAQPGKIVKLDDGAAQTARLLNEIKQQIKAAEEAKAEMENAIRAAMGDAECALLPDGSSFSITRVKETTVPATTRRAYTKLNFRKAK